MYVLYTVVRYQKFHHIAILKLETKVRIGIKDICVALNKKTMARKQLIR